MTDMGLKLYGARQVFENLIGLKTRELKIQIIICSPIISLMTSNKRFSAAKACDDHFPLNQSRLVAQVGWIGGETIIQRGVAKVVSHRIEVVVQHDLLKIMRIAHQFATKIIHKQGTSAIVTFVVSLRISVEKIAELLHHKFRGIVGCSQEFSRLRQRCEQLHGAYLRKQMKVVGQQSIGKSPADWNEVFMIQVKEIEVVSIFSKKVFAADRMVV